jgi:hypothetical protein
MKQVGRIEAVPELRRIVDTYDLTPNPNPASSGLLFWEFEPGRPFPNQPAIKSMLHAYIHLGNLRLRVQSEIWDPGADTIPELFCIARRIERACNRQSDAKQIIKALGEYTIGTTSDIVTATIDAETPLRERVLHDDMHAQLTEPKPKISVDLSDYALDTSADLWAIGLLSCGLIKDYNPQQALAERLNSLAHRFSNGLLSTVVTLSS